MAAKTFVPQLIKMAKKIASYHTKHATDLEAQLTGPGELTALNNLANAAQTFVTTIPIEPEEP